MNHSVDWYPYAEVTGPLPEADTAPTRINTGELLRSLGTPLIIKCQGGGPLLSEAEERQSRAELAAIFQAEVRARTALGLPRK